MSKQTGSTIIELISIVVFTAIIVLVAKPAYSHYEREAKFMEAYKTLLTLHAREDQYWSNNHQYSPGSCSTNGLPSGSTSFSYTCNVDNSRQGYLIMAKGQGKLRNYSFTIDQAGNKVTHDFPGIQKLPISCWLNDKGICLIGN